ncbi:hypothetical protein RZS08_09830, partial [Arthrospira platensis SPKY1]|nr:hypothetical protein [Arthrospira platensis SPKY1]
MALAAAVAVDLHAAAGRAAGDVADRHQAAGEGVEVDRPRPELAAVGGGEQVGVVAQIDFQPIACRQADVLEMKDDELGAAGRRGVGKGVRPGVGGVG